MYDVAIINGNIADGTGTQIYRGNIYIKDGIIKRIGAEEAGHKVEAEKIIDAQGLIVSPGFIDVHSHNDLIPFISENLQELKLKQGVTTELVGQCGLGTVPCVETESDLWKQYVKGVVGDPGKNYIWNFPDFKSFITALKNKGIRNNYAALITQGAIRAAVMGFENRKADPGELEKMKSFVSEAMENGAFGISMGLQYLPGIFTDENELVELCSIVAQHDGVMMVHVRNHDYYMGEAVKEVIRIAEKSGVRLHVSHMRSYKKEKWGVNAEKLLSIIDEGIKRGVEITFDQHFYVSGSTLLTQVLPPWVTEGSAEEMVRRLSDRKVLDKLKKDYGKQDMHYSGWDDYGAIAGWDNIMITSLSREENKEFLGMTIGQIAERLGMEPVEAAAKLLISERGGINIVCLNIFSEEDIERLMKHKAQMIGSDSIPSGVPHPRLYGNFPLYISKFVRDKKVISLEEAIYKASGKPAELLRLKDRGTIEEGRIADITVFDLKNLKAYEDYKNPRKAPEGIKYVLLKGNVALNNGRTEDRKYGEMLVFTKNMQ